MLSNNKNPKEIKDDISVYNINFSQETRLLLRKLKIILLISTLVILFSYTLIDFYVHHEGDLHQTIFSLNFHEFWIYLIIVLFFVLIYLFSYFLIRKQHFLDSLIKESEERYLRLITGAYDLFSSIQDGIVILDKDLNIIHVNPAIEKFYSNRSQIIGKKCFEIYENRSGPCNDCPNLSLIKEKIIKSKMHAIYDENGIQKGWLEIYSFPLFNQDTSKLVGIINYCKDITEKVKAEQLIIEENEKLSELNKFRKCMITRVSHELKTPLNSIQSASQHIINNYNNLIDPKIEQFIKIIYRGGLRLTTLVENILDLSMIDSSKYELNKEKVNLSEIVQNCIEEMTFLAIKRNLTLKSKLPNKLILEVDHIRIEQVILNLLSNAIKNTPPNGVINVIVLENNSHVDLKIKDSGIGLTEEEIKKLFTPFGKLERCGKNLKVDNEGTGIGLYLSKEIVELHGGKILVESFGRNQGSTFIVRLFKNGVINN